MDEKYNFVQGVNFDDVNNLSVIVRSHFLSDIKNERTSQQATHALIKVCAGFFGICFFLLSFVLTFMFLFFLLCLMVLVYFNQSNNENIEIEIKYNPTENLIEYVDHISNKTQRIYNPQKIRLVTRFLAGRGEIVSLSVEFVGCLENEKGVSSVRLTEFRYSSIDNSKSRITDASLEFKFLADWLKIPLIVEQHAYYYHSNCRVY